MVSINLGKVLLDGSGQLGGGYFLTRQQAVAIGIGGHEALLPFGLEGGAVLVQLRRTRKLVGERRPGEEQQTDDEGFHEGKWPDGDF